MIAYIQTDTTGNYYNVNAYVANEGFVKLGWETRKYINPSEIQEADPEILVVGGIANVRKRLEFIGKPKTGAEIDYPEELKNYLGRRIWASTLGAISRDPSSWGIFIKPKALTKSFAGTIVKSSSDFIGFGLDDNQIEIWCSEPVSFRTEWRCFVRYKQLLDLRQYKGAWDSKIDLETVRSAIQDFRTAPAAYALDFGIDEKGEMKLVEVNDGHSLGSYGMSAIDYARFLSARWAEMTGTKDYADF
jgi:hypothetical protein